MVRARGRGRAVTAVLLTAVRALVGCGGNDKETTEPATTQPRDLEAEVLAAYRAGWAALDAAADPPNPEHPALSETKTGPALAAIQQGLSGYRERGVVYRGTAEFSPRVVSVTPSRAEVEDCVLDHGKLIDGASGRVVQEPSGVRKRWKSVMVIADGGWKAEDMRIEGTC